MTARPGDRITDEAIGVPVAEWINVALIPGANDNLHRLQKLTGLSRTDIINRAVSLYEFIDAHIRADREVLILDKRTGETQIVQIG